VDRIYCLNVRSGYPYAVADAYRDWYDLNDEEVLRMIAE
jgi:predicted phosphoribosyltransferase